MLRVLVVFCLRYCIVVEFIMSQTFCGISIGFGLVIVVDGVVLLSEGK